MTLDASSSCELPHLLEPGWSPPLSASRRFWRYVHQWRSCFFGWWTKDCPTLEEDDRVGRIVDHFVGLGLLREYVKRRSSVSMPTLQEIGNCTNCSTVRTLCDAFCHSLSEPILRAVFSSEWIPADAGIPPRLIESNWERRLGNAVSLLFRDRPLPLSFFGDYHQLCVANPLRRQPTPDGRSVRYERGIHYTPAPIVDYLVASTLRRTFASRSAEDARGVCILDPSCGCGAFLLASLRHLLQDRQEKDGEFGGTGTSAIQDALDVLGSSVWGTDIDEIAVAWTRQLLLLAVWEWGVLRKVPRDDHDIRLPDLNRNITCRSFLDAETVSSLGQVDVIIGGPPFVRLQELHRSQRGKLREYRKAFRSAQRGQFDLYMLFIEQALRLLRPGGHLAFSLSNSFLHTASGANIRRIIACESRVYEIVEFEDKQVYPDAVTQIALLSLGKGAKPKSVRHARVRGTGNLRQALGHLLSGGPASHPQIDINELPDSIVDWPNWALIAREDVSWLADLRFRGTPLYYQTLDVGQRLQTGADDVLMMREVGRTFRRVVFARSRIDGKTYRLEADITRPIIRGRHVRGYQGTATQYLCIFPHDAAGRAWPEDMIAREYPLAYQYLMLHQSRLSKRRRPKGMPWYAASFTEPDRLNGVKRIIGSKIAAAGGFTLATDESLLCHDSVLTIVPDVSKVDPFLLLGILNSSIFWRFAALVTPRMGTGRQVLRVCDVCTFPIPKTDSAERTMVVDGIRNLVQRVLMPAERSSDSRPLLAQIDEQVGLLYGFME